jgi:hypothetical protein
MRIRIRTASRNWHFRFALTLSAIVHVVNVPQKVHILGYSPFCTRLETVTLQNKAKKKVKVVSVLSSALCHEDIWGSGVTAPPFLTSAIGGGEWSPSRTGCFTPGEIVPGTHWVGGWVGPRAGLDIVEKRIILPLPGFEPLSSSP